MIAFFLGATPMQHAILTAAQFASMRGIPHSTLRLWLRSGLMPTAFKLGRDWLIPADAPLPERPRGNPNFRAKK
jgi:hypothetical protein